MALKRPKPLGPSHPADEVRKDTTCHHRPMSPPPKRRYFRTEKAFKLEQDVGHGDGWVVG